MSNNHSFFEKVYEVVKQIPEGRVCTYGLIAQKIGSPQSARMVGYAMNASHTMPHIPAHRVVNRNGMLTGKHHFVHPNLMQELLENEGVKVKNDKIVNFTEVLWRP